MIQPNAMMVIELETDSFFVHTYRSYHRPLMVFCHLFSFSRERHTRVKVEYCTNSIKAELAIDKKNMGAKLSYS